MFSEKALKENMVNAKCDLCGNVNENCIEVDINKYTDLIEPGIRFLTPYEEFIRCPFYPENDKMYDVVIMWIGGEGMDIQLF